MNTTNFPAENPHGTIERAARAVSACAKRLMAGAPADEIAAELAAAEGLCRGALQFGEFGQLGEPDRSLTGEERATAFMLLGSALAMSGRFSPAAHAVEMGIEIAPDSLWGYELLRAWAAERAGLWTEAEAARENFNRRREMAYDGGSIEALEEIS